MKHVFMVLISMILLLLLVAACGHGEISPVATTHKNLKNILKKTCNHFTHMIK